MMPQLSSALRGFYAMNPKQNPFPQPPRPQGGGGAQGYKPSTSVYQPPQGLPGGKQGWTGGTDPEEWDHMMRLSSAQMNAQPRGLSAALRY